MKTISLGGLDVSRVGQGVMSMSAFYTGAGIDDGIVLTPDQLARSDALPAASGERHDGTTMAAIDR